MKKFTKHPITATTKSYNELPETLKAEAKQLHDDLKDFWRKAFRIPNIDEYITDKEFDGIRRTLDVLEDVSLGVIISE